MELPIPTLEQQNLLEFIQIELKNQTGQNFSLDFIKEKIYNEYGRYPEPYDLEQKPESIKNIVAFLRGKHDE